LDHLQRLYGVTLVVQRIPFLTVPLVVLRHRREIQHLIVIPGVFLHRVDQPARQVVVVPPRLDTDHSAAWRETRVRG
jgi:hypothetical protein